MYLFLFFNFLDDCLVFSYCSIRPFIRFPKLVKTSKSFLKNGVFLNQNLDVVAMITTLSLYFL